MELSSRPAVPEDAAWTRHATGTLTPDAPAVSSDLVAWPPAGAEPVGLDGCYRRFADLGIDYGPAFRGLRALWRRGEEVFAEVALAEEDRADAGRYGLHPALLDAALQAYAAGAEQADGPTPVPFAWHGVSVRAAGATALRVRLAPAGPDAVTVEAADPAGVPVATVASLRSRRLPGPPPAPAPCGASAGRRCRRPRTRPPCGRRWWAPDCRTPRRSATPTSPRWPPPAPPCRTWSSCRSLRRAATCRPPSTPPRRTRSGWSAPGWPSRGSRPRDWSW
ncbi:polyketide synthase dehydratase domain-containing protein [Kitasatospora aburaviensis]